MRKGDVSTVTLANRRLRDVKPYIREASMRFIWVAVLSLAALPNAHGGDDASGPISFQVDLSQHFTTYSLTAQDKLWSASLAARFLYKGAAVHFVRTSLLLKIGGKTVQGAVYQAIERPDVFYAVNGDVMLKLDTQWAYNPGVGGFSMGNPSQRIL